MIKKFNKAIFSILALLLIISYPTPSLALEDKIIAVVNDELITFRDLQNYLRQTYMELSTQGLGEEQLKAIMQDLEKNGLNKLIEDNLILSKATEIGIEVRKQLIDQRVNEIKSKYADEQDFVKALVDNGATVSDLRKKILNQFKIKFIIEYKVKSNIRINPQDVTTFYTENIDQFREDEKITLASIYIAFTDGKDMALKKAQEALDKINSDGMDFNNVAKEYSDAPSIGTVEKGQFMPKIENIVFSLDVDDISPLVEVESGIYIFKLLRKIPPQVATLEDVKDNIYALIYDKKFKENFLTWLDELKQDAYIEIK